MKTTLPFCLLCLLGYGAAHAQTFAPVVNYSTTVNSTSNPLGITSADFNNDGHLDIAATNVSYSGIGATRAIAILRGSANGTFAAPVGIQTTTGLQSMVSADFNGDNKPDLAAVSLGDNNLSIYANTTTSPTSTITMTAAVNYTAGSGGGNRDLITADFNGDNRPDIAVANTTGGNTLVFINNPTSPGTFLTPVAYATGSYPQSIAYGDVDGDGKTDLIVGNTNSFSASVLKGTGTGTFSAAVNYQLGDRVVSVQLANFTANARPEIVALKSPLNPSMIAVLTNSGTGTFGTPANFNTAYNTERRIVAGDFNMDGKTDVASANGSSTASVYLGNGTGALASPINYSLGATGESQKIIVGDFNKDGRPDLAMTRYNGSTVSVMLNTTPAPANTITTGNLSSTGYCAGSAVVVPYTQTGTYNSGNVFKVQLSDASGSFAAPITLSTLKTASGSITAGIPSSITNSSLYRVRVVSSTPVVNGSPNNTDLTISSAPVPAITITTDPDPADICAGTPVTLTASSSGSLTYTWSPNIALSSTSGATVVASPTTTTTYTVKGTNGVCSRTMSVTITVFEGCLMASSTSVAEQKAMTEESLGSSEIKLYPNPAQERVVISTPTAEKGYIQVLNSHGRPVREIAISQMETEINLAGLAPSLYYVSVVQGSSRTSKRLVVAR